MSEEELNALRVQPARLMEDLHFTAQWGEGERYGPSPTETGMCRLALTDTDKSVRDWFVETAEALGCHVTVDAMGNIFAVRPGIRTDGAPTFVGSHLDTQPSGGRYDGILGVIAGIEMLKVLTDHWVDTEYPVGVVNWTNEEGARFPISMVSSGVWADEIPLQRAHNLKEVGGGKTATMLSELKRIGYLGSRSASYRAMPMAAHFELHIEQGPILESENKKIGIVTGVQAYRWFTIEVKGRDCHTGTTGFRNRADALLAASKMILHSHRAATQHNALASTGILSVKPGSTNTVPGTVRFALDLRAKEDYILDELVTELRPAFSAIATGEDVGGLNTRGTRGQPCTVSWSTDVISHAVDFHQDCIECVRKSVKAEFGDAAEGLSKEMISGSGHDSVMTSKRCPSSMIFVPCRDGISHNPAEYASEEDCAIGAQVLLQSVLRFDRLRARRRLTWAQE